MRACTACVLLVATVIGCGPTTHKKGGGGGSGDVDAAPIGPHTLNTIVINPTNPIVQLDLNMASSAAFTAMGEYLDGTTEDLTAQVTWTLQNPAVGVLTGPTLAIPAFPTATAVSSTITASLSGLAGQAQITVVAYRQTGAQQDFFFILPYLDPGGQVDKPLQFSTAVPGLDVFFLMDTTGSMSGEISNLKTALTSTVVPGIQAAVANSAFGVGALEDFPLGGYGSPQCTSGDNTADQPFKLRQAITTSTAAVQAGVSSLAIASGSPIGCGVDGPEGGLEAIYQAATGEGLSSPAPTNIPANHTGIGGVGFRTGTMPVIVAISDADWHGAGEPGNCSGQQEAYAAPVAGVAHSRAQTKTALANICGRLVGLSASTTGESPSCTSQAQMEDLATATGARVPPAAWDVGVRPAGCAANQCCTDLNGAGRAPDVNGLCPVVFKVTTTGTGVGTSVVTGIQMLTRFAAFDVTRSATGGTTDITGAPLPIGHTTADFLKTIAPASFTLPPPPPNLPNPTFDATTFHNVTPNTKVDFTVAAYNDFVMQTNQAQIFRAKIEVQASGCTTLDQRDVLILVPPTPIVIQ